MREFLPRLGEVKEAILAANPLVEDWSPPVPTPPPGAGQSSNGP